VVQKTSIKGLPDFQNGLLLKSLTSCMAMMQNVHLSHEIPFLIRYSVMRNQITGTAK
jgi:hypothetical protein